MGALPRSEGAGDAVLAEDVSRAVAGRPGVFAALDGRRILLTGGTGFVGVWMIRTLLEARQQLGIHTETALLSRDPDRFVRRYPELASDEHVRFVKGDIREPLDVAGSFDLVVHAAAETNASLADPPPIAYHKVGLLGTMHVAELARRCGAQRILFTSSGAVYGADAFAEGEASEDAPASPLTTEPRAAYGNAKRAAEAYLAALGASGGPTAIIARLFAFVGPGLPLRSGYAVGNFIADGLAGGPIRVAGDGTPLRSYLYVADMALWLWTLAVEGNGAGPYNVGSEDAVSIADLAWRVAHVCGRGVSVDVASTASPGVRPNRYVPSTRRARIELGLREMVTLDEAITRTVAWYRADEKRQ